MKKFASILLPLLLAIVLCGRSAAAVDLFDSLRAASDKRSRSPLNWQELAETVGRLKTLDGLYVDRATGQIVLYGEPGDGDGPIRPGDIFTALRSEFFVLEEVGMTIDPDEQNPHGPSMPVRYFGGTQNTRIGQVMFECDRLMKCLGMGRDNVTGQPLKSRVPQFATQAQLPRAARGAPGGASPALEEELWNRFWITLNTNREPADQGYGKSLVGVVANEPLLEFTHHRLFVDTERMYRPAGSGTLLSSGGQQTAGARQFADHLTVHYDEIGGEFPVFEELKQLSKLVVAARWVREKKWPIDPEMLYYHVGETETTPRTPASWVEYPAQGVKIFGGVSLDPNTGFVAKDPNKAAAFGDLVKAQRQPLQEGRPLRLPSPDGRDRLVVPVGPTITAPPTSSQRRTPVHIRERDRTFEPSSRQDKHPVTGRYEIGAWLDSTTGREILNAPVLRQIYTVRETATETWGEGAQAHKVNIPAWLYITSPLRDIHVEFILDSKFDPQRNAPYFESNGGDMRYYPGMGEVVSKDGPHYRFDADGLLESVHLPDGSIARFSREGYADGPLYQASSDPTGRPRGPPIRMGPTTGENSPSSRPSSHMATITIQNPANGAILEVRPHGNELQFIDR